MHCYAVLSLGWSSFGGDVRLELGGALGDLADACPFLRRPNRTHPATPTATHRYLHGDVLVPSTTWNRIINKNHTCHST
jgi:hypothetical protein